MYKRVTHYRYNTSRLDELPAKWEEIKKELRTIPGVVDIYLAWRADGTGLTTSIFESATAADAATWQVNAVMVGLFDYWVEPPSADTYENVLKLSG